MKEQDKTPEKQLNEVEIGNLPEKEFRLMIVKMIQDLRKRMETKIEKQPKCPSTDEWIKKMWSIYTMEYYSAIKRNKIGSFVEKLMNLETVIQSEVSQKEKNKYHILTHICRT